MRACFIWDKGCGKPRKRIKCKSAFLLSKLKIRRRENRHNIEDRIATVPEKMRSETAKTLK